MTRWGQGWGHCPPPLLSPRLFGDPPVSPQFHAEYGDIIKETLACIRRMDGQEWARVVLLSLQQVRGGSWGGFRGIWGCGGAPEGALGFLGGLQDVLGGLQGNLGFLGCSRGGFGILRGLQEVMGGSRGGFWGPWGALGGGFRWIWGHQGAPGGLLGSPGGFSEVCGGGSDGFGVIGVLQGGLLGSLGGSRWIWDYWGDSGGGDFGVFLTVPPPR